MVSLQRQFAKSVFPGKGSLWKKTQSFEVGEYSAMLMAYTWHCIRGSFLLMLSAPPQEVPGTGFWLTM